MKQIVREAAVVVPAVAVLFLIPLLKLEGRLFPNFVAPGQWDKLIGDGYLYMSAPGLIVELSIWGYSSGRTIWSDLVFISVNTIVYSTLIILFLWGLRRLRSNHKSA